MRKSKVKITCEYWNRSENPDVLSFEYPGIDLSLDEYTKSFKAMLLWLTFAFSQIDSIFDEEYREEQDEELETS